MQIIPQPDWRTALAPGYCGFITRRHDLVGDGIQYFERFENGLPFVHTFVIEDCRSGGNDALNSPIQNPKSAISIIEAHATTGVARATLDEYLADPTVATFVRVPLGWTPEIGRAIVAAAAAHLGERYAFPLILADALANTFLGHCLNRLTFNLPDRFVCRVLANAHQKICSQLVALALQSQPSLKQLGCLRRPADTILPKELGNDPALWEPCVYKLETETLTSINCGLAISGCGIVPNSSAIPQSAISNRK